MTIDQNLILLKYIIKFKQQKTMDSKNNAYSLESISTQLCQEGFCHRPQLLHALWEGAKKVITTNCQQNKYTLLANSFVSWVEREPNKSWYNLEPTEMTLKECGLKIQNQDIRQFEKMGVINQINLYSQMVGIEKDYFKSDKELLLRLFYLLISKIKEVLKENRNAEICLQNFGTIRVAQKKYYFQPFVLNEKVFSPNLKYKRYHSKEARGEKSQESKYTVQFVDSINQHRSSSQLRKRPYFHQLIVANEPANTKISNDLLGAGIDPLTYNVDFSKLANNSSQLLSQQFTKPEHHQGRFPCVIDKFSRTKGSQLTGIKVGNSIVVRIGSNYSPSVKNYYLDITTKAIQYITPEARIKLQSSKQRGVQPASETQQYAFITGKQSKQLESRVALRKQLYQRYCQYYQKFIPNNCVAPLDRASVERIINQVKVLVKKIGRKDGSPLINGLMEEANNEYYLAYKKAVLDYILKDKDEMVRTGINISFKAVREWGKPIKKKLTPSFHMYSLKESKRLLELNHILYPECLNKIYMENQKINAIQLFKKRKEGEYRPYSILYYIKRNVNQLNEAFSMLCEGWAKKISTIIEEHINLKQESYQKLKQFFNSIHIIMSNKLKELVYGAISDILKEFTAFEINPTQQKNLLMINITENSQNITFIDDIEKVFRFELLQIVDKIIETTKKVPRVESYLKLSTDLFVWGVEETDTFVVNTKEALNSIVKENYERIKDLKNQLKKLEQIFTMIEKVAIWCRQHLKVDDLSDIFNEIHDYQRKIQTIKCYYMANMVVIDCIQLKKKLFFHLKSLKKLIFDTVDERMKTKNASILSKISQNIKLICKEVSSTSQLVDLYQSIEQIKQYDMIEIRSQIEQNVKDTMLMFTINGFSANLDVMKSTYLCKHSFEELTLQIYRNQKRLYEERLDLERKLRDKINRFQADTLSCFKEINSKIDSFDMRKLYSEYLGVLGEYKDKVENNKQTQKVLNMQQEDLKWTPSLFPHAKELENIVEPNYDLWLLVSQYDVCMKEWKYIELSHFDIDTAESKMTVIDGKVTKLISRLKNFAGLKIVYDLQNDVKQFLGQQVSIIKIFSNAGLKDRHWNLFNKRLPLSGYDLKELTYGRIKLLYDYEKNLKVLMSISNQAAKQFQIENQKQEMHDYWNKLSFALYHINDENIIFIDKEFLDQQIQLIDHHLTKTVILKNSPFSKALVTMLTEWENWLINGKKILISFRSSQEKFMVVRNIFKMDEINKLLPIQSTEYDSIENIWKSVIKKILDQPRVTQFFKSQKMPEIIEEIGKKADFIKSSFNSYLTLKRMDFTRLYFLSETTILHIISLLAVEQTAKALLMIGQFCFNGVRNCYRQDNSHLLLKSGCDQLQVRCEFLHSKKGKSKFFQELVVIEKNMRENIKMQIKMLGIEKENYQKNIEKSTLTALFTAIEIEFSALLRDQQSLGSIEDKYQILRDNITKKAKVQPNIKYQYLLSKILFMCERCQELKKKNSIDLDQMVLFEYSLNDLQLKFFNQTINYHFEYVGDEAPAFIPTSSDRLIWQIAYSMNQNVGAVCEFKQSIKQIGHFAGQFVVDLASPALSEENNFDSCIMGIVATNYWIHFNDQFLKKTCQMLAKLTHIYQLKKQKIERGGTTLSIKSNQLNINCEGMIFLSITKERCCQLPQGLLTCTRSLSLANPFPQIKGYLEKFDKFTALKQYLQMLKHQYEEIDVCKIFQQFCLTNTLENNVEVVKAAIWKHIDFERQMEFMTLFCEEKEPKEEIQFKNSQAYIKTKTDQIDCGFKWSDLVIVIGEQSYKSKIIEQFLKQRQSELFNEDRGVNLSFIQQGVSEMTYLMYLQKAKQKLLKEEDDMFIYIDSDVSQEQLKTVQLFLHLHSISPEHSTPLKIIIQTNSLAYLEPSFTSKACLVCVKQQGWQDSRCFKQWINNLNVSSSDKTIISQYEHSFESLLNFVVRMEKRPFNDSKLMLSERFFSFFQIFLDNLNSKQIERMCELEKQSYISNSFVYSIFWALGVCSLRSIQVQALKKHLSELFAQKLDLPGELDQIYLTEDNEWVYWQTLKEEFVTEKDAIPFYQIWVPTANNTKLLTLLVKLVEKNKSILLCGSQSGKSTLLNEISCFELSFNPFFIDCHKNMSSHHLATLTRGKVLFGQSKNTLILIDDLYLPDTQVCGILRTFIQRGYCINESSTGKLNEFISKPAMISTWKGDGEQSRCFWRFFGKNLPFQLQKFQEKELEYIFKTYINCLLPSNQGDLNFFKTESTILNYCVHTMKAFPAVQPKHMRLILESICKVNPAKGQRYIVEHLLIQTQSILSQVISANETTHFFRHLCHYYSKFLTIQLRNQNDLKEINKNYLYDIREVNQKDKKQTIEDRTEWMQQIVTAKNPSFFLSQAHARVLQRLFWSLKGNHSHVIILSQPSNGCRALAKMTGWLLNIGSNDFTKVSVGGLLEEIVKVLKTGGKVDECVNILDHEVINSHPDFLKLINSLIFSPEFHECFGQILMEQIIKSFNSEKKFLKKNVKKAELIKKIREKFNNIYHFCMCISSQGYVKLLEQYPKFGSLRAIELQEWPSEALLAVSKRFIPQKHEEVFPLLARIEEQIKAKWQLWGKSPTTAFLCILALYDKIIKLLQARASNNDTSEMWSKRVKMNKEKLQNLEGEKKIYEFQHQEYFQNLNKIGEKITEASLQYQTLKQTESQIRVEYESIMAQCNNLKNQFEQTDHELHQEYESFIESNRYQFLSDAEQYLGHPNFQRIANAYQFSIEKINSQLIQLFYQFEQDYFNKLNSLNFSQLGMITMLITKFQTKMQTQYLKQNELSFKFTTFTAKESELKELELKIREAEDKVSDVKDDQTTLKEAKDPALKRYEETVKKIQQYEAINNILLKYQYVLRSKNDSICPIPNNLVGPAILATYMFAYCPLLQEDQLSSFQSMIIDKLAESKIKVEPQQLKAFFTQEEQFQLTYKNFAEIDEWINLLAIQSNEMSLIILGQTENVTNFVNRSMNNKIGVWLKQPEQLKDFLQQDHIIYINKPDKTTIEHFSYLMSRPMYAANNAKSLRVDDEEINVHENCKIVFIYSSLEQVPAQLLLSGIFILKAFNHEKTLLGMILQDRLRKQKMVSNRSDLVGMILKGYEEMSSIDQKMHSIITKMRKQNVVSQIIFKRIEEEGENKLNTGKQIEKHKKELVAIGNTVQVYQPLIAQISRLYKLFQNKMTFSAYLTIFSNLLEMSDTRLLQKIPQQLQNYLKLLFDCQKTLKQQQKIKFQKLITKLIKSGRLALIVPDLSIAFEWLQDLLDEDAQTINKFQADTVAISDIKEKDINVGVMSRPEQMHLFSQLCQNNRQRIKNFKLLVIALSYIEVPPYLRSAFTVLTIYNPLIMVSDEICKAKISRFKEKSGRNQRLYQDLMDSRWLVELKKRQTQKLSYVAQMQLEELLDYQH